MNILGSLITLYTVVLLLRVVTSWFPPASSQSPMASVQLWLYKATEPVLAPIRRTLPSMGGLDLSPMLLLIALQILGRALG
ncbi:MAG: YggT family protein [Ilumatobacteraceae bacterium]|jgi:YggT family protein|nr:YggT family protein [Actinomycetota bacterium]MDP4649347.1 YggT family protein [Ilumatobacteraceae bacterium]MDA3018902.1 YggT family protein [Actinomycetota bacterium]MDP4706018.1 YggT family protein [Ilumatobacteraceae bacterium]MDP4713872.1 YggT family protein [Ilumatobacteraceae bacterium]